MTYQIINPEPLGAPRGWNHGMLGPADGRILFIAGQVASDSTGCIASTDFVEQFSKALANVLAVVQEAGGTPESVGRLTIFVREVEIYLGSLKSLGVAYRSVMGRHYPAMTLVEVSRLLDPAALVEIEATAVIAQTHG